jgi:hypothetical protein
MHRQILAGFILLTLSGCAATGRATQSVTQEEDIVCPENMVLVCAHMTRIENVDRDCRCEAERQILNTTIQ